MAKLIEFTAFDNYIEAETEEVYPKPIKFYLSDWYKDLPEFTENMGRTVKACKPFFDTQITGYAIPNPRTLKIKHNYVNDDGYRDMRIDLPIPHWQSPEIQKLNILTQQNVLNNVHPKVQLGDKCPYHQTHVPNASYGYPKILLPWRIKTPLGYSCLIMPPLNKIKKNYEILSGIVDTDTYNKEINLPFRVHGKSDTEKEFTIEKGEIIAQIIPYKKESWQMKINKYPIKDYEKYITSRFLFYATEFANYARTCWRKVTWK